MKDCKNCEYYETIGFFESVSACIMLEKRLGENEAEIYDCEYYEDKTN